METLLNTIHKIEDKHLYLLYSSLNTIFKDTRLPSHDLQHHIRVWLHCRGLMIELHKAGLSIDETLIEKALIACFFHDTGLTVTLDEQHGYSSAQFCKNYLENHLSILTNAEKNEIITAVELHDDKSVKAKPVTKPDEMLQLNLLVSTADDLDALGFIGVFRYIEIYLKRGIDLKELPRKVTHNLRNRFTSFTNAYSSLHRYADRQRLRYHETIDFFTRLEADISENSNSTDSPLHVTKILKQKLVVESSSIDETITYALKTQTAPYPSSFFTKLRSELEVTTAIPIY